MSLSVSQAPVPEYLEVLAPHLSKWDGKRALSSVIEQCFRVPDYDWYTRYADRIRECSNLLDCGWVPDEDGVVKLQFARTNYCRVRWCTVCAWRRQLSWQARFIAAMPEIKQRWPTHRWLFLTLTVKNCETTGLRDQLTAMNKAFVLLSKRKQWPSEGWIKSVEVTHGQDGNSHPHFHVLMMVRAGYFQARYYLSQKRWAELWKSCLRVDYTPIVDVRAVKGDLEKAVLETLKYSVKSSEAVQDPAWLLEIAKQLHKTRAVSIGGCLREILREEEPEPDEAEDEAVPLEAQFEYDKLKGKYRLKT